MQNVSLIPKIKSEAVKIRLLAENIYMLEVTYGLIFKDGHYVKAPPFEEYVARARELVKARGDSA
jgi:hypothetical protein